MIARYSLIEKTLSKQLIGMTEVGKIVFCTKRGIPFLKLNHIHFESTLVEAYTRGAYDSIIVDRL